MTFFDSVLITGGSEGLGKNLVAEFLPLCNSLVNVDLRPSPVVDSKITNIIGDFADNLVQEQILEIFEKLNIQLLILNAASLINDLLFTTSRDRIEYLLDVNIKSNTIIMANFLKHAKDNSRNLNRDSYLVIISSTAAYMPTPSMSIYGASKSYLSQLATNLMLEVRDSNLRVMCFEPSGMKTEFQRIHQVKNSDSNLLLDPKKVAISIRNTVLDKKSGVFRIGVVSKALIFLQRILPRRTYTVLIGEIFAKIR